MSSQIIAAAIASNIANENNSTNRVGGEPTFFGCPVVNGLSGGISRRYSGTRFVRTEGVEINAIQGVFIIEGAGVECRGVECLGVRLAETRLVRTSRTGRTSWPALVEAGWVPGFRADQIPSPAALRGLSRFVVFPVDSTGHSDWQADVIETSAWAEAMAAWESWRQQEGPLPSSAEGTWRLARNHTRTRGGWWTGQEVVDLLKHANDAVLEDHGDEGLLFWSEGSCVFGWASSNIFDTSSGEVASVWPLGLRKLPESFSRDGLTIESIQIINNRLHWKFVSSEGVGIYADCHDYTVLNGSPRPPFQYKEWLEAVKTAMQHARLCRAEKILNQMREQLEDVVISTDEDEEY